MEAGFGIGRGLGGVSEDAGQVWAKVSNSDAESLRQLPDSARAGAAALLLNETEEGAGNTRFLTNFVSREAIGIDVFGDVHTELLHYVNFSGKGYFT